VNPDTGAEIAYICPEHKELLKKFLNGEIKE
jgi:hypothetical protein